MENYSKLIDEVFKRLDWDHIMRYFETQHGDAYEDTTSKKGKKVRVTTKSVFAIKKELRDLVKFVIDSNFNELQHNNWIIFWSNKESGYRLEIVFTPTRAVMCENDNSPEEEDPVGNSDEIERDVLKEMLVKSVKEENYELSAVIHSRLKKLDKAIKDNKKNGIY